MQSVTLSLVQSPVSNSNQRSWAKGRRFCAKPIKKPEPIKGRLLIIPFGRKWRWIIQDSMGNYRTSGYSVTQKQAREHAKEARKGLYL